MIDLDTYKKIIQYDPTMTTALRNAFCRDMKQRFNELKLVISKAIVLEDCLGIKDRGLKTHQLNTPGNQAFSYMRDPEKISAFMEWLQKQIDKGLLSVGEFAQVGFAIEEAWTNKYIFDSYKRGVARARYELQKVGYKVPSLEATGGVEAIEGLPFHMDRVGVLYGRVYSELKGITAQMDTVISRILAQGMIDGEGPRKLARQIVASIDGEGAGTVGITDKLGRFIPAQRRALMLARTEIIRAYFLATVQEYRNWRVENVYVMAEWGTAKDERVCSECSSLEGKLFTLEEIEPMIPKHPNCLIDQQTPIYTSEGWKEIGKIKIGDYVLTHKRRFQRVYALPRHQEKADCITLTFIGHSLSITTNHPILMEGGIWKEAGECQIGDRIMLLGNECKRCKKPIPYFRKYCSRSCLSKDTTEKQWANPKHRENMSKKTSAQLYLEYETGVRNPKTIVKKAHEKMRQMVIDGSYGYWKDAEYYDKMNKATHTPEIRKKSSDRMKIKNPMYDPIIAKKSQSSVELFYRNNPEKRLNVRMGNHRKSNEMTWIEKRMSELLDKIGIQYVYQYPILRYDVDFAIPALKIVIECDGEYWHRDKKKDAIRDENIKNEGWFILHYSGTKINQCLDEIEQEVSRVIYNHLGEYELAVCTIDKIEKWTLKRNRVLYNLSVEEDESYIAKGVVVHNCRCFILPYLKELEKYY